MNVEEVFQFMNGESLAVLATATENGQPEAALMGFAVTPGLEIIFDTVKSSRKSPNLKEESARGMVDRLHDGSNGAV